MRQSSGPCYRALVDKAVLLGLAPAGGGGGDDGDDVGFGDDKTYASAASSRERRRLSIKAAKVRRRKQEVEITAMEAEDERSKLENQAHRVSWICRNLGEEFFGAGCASQASRIGTNGCQLNKYSRSSFFGRNAIVQAMLEIRLQRQTEMARKAAAMRRQMAAEVSAAGGGQTAASIVHSMDSGSTGGGSGGGGSGGAGGGGGGDGSLTEGGSVGAEGGVGEGGGGGEIVDAGAGPTLFDVSSQYSHQMHPRVAVFCLLVLEQRWGRDGFRGTGLTLAARNSTVGYHSRIAMVQRLAWKIQSSFPRVMRYVPFNESACFG